MARLTGNEALRAQQTVDMLARFTNAWRLVQRQADDEGLWFQAQTAPEAYLQQELRKLHAAIEGVTLDEQS